MTGKPVLIGTLLITISSTIQGDIYKWNDSAGNVHYTNTQPETGYFEKVSIENCTAGDCLQEELERAETTIKEVEAIEEWLESRRKFRAKQQKKPSAIYRNISFDPGG